MIEDLWYKNAVIYSLDLETFMDADGDGIGDFEGLTLRLDYLHAMGIDTIWLAPFQPTPNRDNGYDVCDYYGVDHRHGSSGDFVEFMHQASKRGIKVIIDLVVNHTSNEHPWFKNARSSKEAKYRDWYVWRDEIPDGGPEGLVFPNVEDSNWEWDEQAKQYYLHRFYKHQPDLNIANPEVRRAIRKDHWKVSPDEEDHHRRSIYLFVRRNLRFPFLEVFDRPDTTATCARRAPAVADVQWAGGICGHEFHRDRLPGRRSQLPIGVFCTQDLLDDGGEGAGDGGDQAGRAELLWSGHVIPPRRDECVMNATTERGRGPWITSAAEVGRFGAMCSGRVRPRGATARDCTARSRRGSSSTSPSPPRRTRACGTPPARRRRARPTARIPTPAPRRAGR